MSSGGFPKSNVSRKGLATLLMFPFVQFVAAAAVLSMGELPDVATAEDSPSQPVAVRITRGDEKRPVSFIVKSSNPHLVSETNVQFREAGHETVMVVTPSANEAGKSLISVYATDGISTATQSFNVTVTAVNDAPTLSKIPDQVIPEDASAPAIPFSAGDVETPAASLIITAMSSDSDLLPKDAIVLAGEGATRTLKASPKPGSPGTVRVTLTVSDGEASTSRDFEIRVGRVNHAPLANAGPDQTIFGTNATALSGTATDNTSDRLTTAWSVVAGPSDVEFANASSLNTTVRFRAHGVYTLRLSVSDGDVWDSDDVTIVVASRTVARTEDVRGKRR
jgi:hypothetical protein